jgi:Putative bacterial sensory transduction regulator
MRSTRVLLAAIAILCSVSANAQPRPGGGGGSPGPRGAPAGGMLTKVTVEQMAQLFKAAGFKSQVVENNGTKMVQTVFWTSDIFGGAIPLGCEKDNSGCHGMKVFANLGKATVDQNWVDAWNDYYFYVRASRSSGNLIFTWDVAFLTGVSPEYVQTAIQWFKQIVDQSTDFKP